MDSPGIERTPLNLLSSHDICSVHWDDVRIPAENLVAGENEGWKLIVNQLNHERVTLCSPGMAERCCTRPSTGPARPRCPTAAG